MSDPAAQRSSITLADGRSLDVWTAGPPTGDALLFHHGTPSAGLPFARHAEALFARGLRFVASSRPGYGSSSREQGRMVADAAGDARVLLDGLGIDRAWVVGWSGGGPHALACAALLPDRVRGTALIGGVAPYAADQLVWLAGMGAENVDEFSAAHAGPEALQAFIEPLAPAIRTISPTDVAAAFGDLVDDVDRGAIDAALAAYLAASDHEGLREGYWGWFDDDMAFIKPWGFELNTIPGPVQVWQGRHDRMVPFAHGQWLAAHIPSARPFLFDEEGHLSIAVGAFPRILDELLATSG